MTSLTTIIGWHDKRVEFRDVTHLGRWAADVGVDKIEVFLIDDTAGLIRPVVGRLSAGKMQLVNLMGEVIAYTRDEPVHTRWQRYIMNYLEDYFGSAKVVEHVAVVPVAYSEWVGAESTDWDRYGFRPALDSTVFVCPELIDAQCQFIGMDDDEFMYYVSSWALRIQLRHAADFSGMASEEADVLVDQQLAVAAVDGFAVVHDIMTRLLVDAAPRPQLR